MPLRPISGPIAAAVLCAACASQPGTIVATPEPLPETAPAAEAPAAAPIAAAPAALADPHAYSLWHLQRGEYRGEATRPAYVKLTLSQDRWSTELAASSGNVSFDQAALDDAPRGQYQVALDAAGDPTTVLICFDPASACPAGPPWTGPEHLRSWGEIQAGIDRLKGSLLKVYNEGVRGGQIPATGKLTMNLTIEASGEVSHCALAQSSYSSETFNRSLTEQACKLNFGPGYDRSFVYGYPVVFQAPAKSG